MISDIDDNQNADAGTGVMLPREQHVASLPNCEMIDTSGQRLSGIGAQLSLSYFDALFRIAVTVANLGGIPYKYAEVPQARVCVRWR